MPEAPAGLIKVRCDCRDGKVTHVGGVRQPASFLLRPGRQVTVDGVGGPAVDIAGGGMTYAIVEAEALGLKLDLSEARDLCTIGQRIKKAAAEQTSVSHPGNAAIPGITQTLFARPGSYGQPRTEVQERGQTYSFIATAARRDEILSCPSAAGFGLPPQAAA